jgi:hypothetical protein
MLLPEFLQFTAVFHRFTPSFFEHLFYYLLNHISYVFASLFLKKFFREGGRERPAAIETLSAVGW